MSFFLLKKAFKKVFDELPHIRESANDQLHAGFAA
jgi:hypothetical protein